MAQRNDYGKRSHLQSDFAGNGGSKRRNPGEDGDPNAIDSEDTVYRYLCPVRKIGSIIGKGGEIAKQLRTDSKAHIRIGETMPGCEERVVTIYSSSEETNPLGDTGELVSPAQDALFMVHDRIVADELLADEEFEEAPHVTVRMLVPSDQIGCVIGKGGQVIQNLRSETGAQIRILNDEHLPPCALSSDELILIIGEASVVRKALYEVAQRLHENPSRSQHLILSSSSNMYQTGGKLMSSHNVAPPTHISPLMSLYEGYKCDTGDWSHSFYPARRDEAPAKDFSLRLVCPTENVGSVIGKSGSIIKQIRQESGAGIKVDSSNAEGDDCIIYISAKEFFDDPSPTIDAALRLQPRCSEKSERESGDSVITTRLLVPSSRVGCLIGKGGAIISEMRSITRASIRILSKENLPKIASEDEELVQITGDLTVASNALLQVLMRLKANVFERDGALAAYPPALPYLPTSIDTPDGSKYGSRSGGRSSYGAYAGYSSGRSSSVGLVGQSPVSHGKRYNY